MSVVADSVRRVPYASLTPDSFRTQFVACAVPVLLTPDRSESKSKGGGVTGWPAYDKWRTPSGLLAAWNTASAAAPCVSVLVSDTEHFGGYALSNQSISLPFDQLVYQAFGSTAAVTSTASASAAAAPPASPPPPPPAEGGVSRKRAAAAAGGGDVVKRVRRSDVPTVPAAQPKAAAAASSRTASDSPSPSAPPVTSPASAPAHQYLCQCPIFSALPLQHRPSAPTASVLPESNAHASPLARLLPDVMPLLSLVPASLCSSINLWLSAGRSASNLHFDDDENLLCILSGCKTVTLFPPDTTPKLYAQPITSASANHSRIPITEMKQRIKLLTSASTGSAAASSDSKSASAADRPFPLFDTASGLQCTLKRGDVLFIPPGWWHQVDSYPADGALSTSAPPTIAVNIWWRSEFALQLAALPPPLPPVGAAAGAAAAAGALSYSSNSFYVRSLLMKLIAERKQRELFGATEINRRVALSAVERTNWIHKLFDTTTGTGTGTGTVSKTDDSVIELFRGVHPLLAMSLLAQASVEHSKGLARLILSLDERCTTVITELLDATEETAEAENATAAAGTATGADSTNPPQALSALRSELASNIETFFTCFGSGDLSRRAIVSHFVAQRERWTASIAEEMSGEPTIIVSPPAETASASGAVPPPPAAAGAGSGGGGSGGESLLGAALRSGEERRTSVPPPPPPEESADRRESDIPSPAFHSSLPPPEPTFVATTAHANAAASAAAPITVVAAPSTAPAVAVGFAVNPLLTAMLANETPPPEQRKSFGGRFSSAATTANANGTSDPNGPPIFNIPKPTRAIPTPPIDLTAAAAATPTPAPAVTSAPAAAASIASSNSAPATAPAATAAATDSAAPATAAAAAADESTPLPTPGAAALAFANAPARAGGRKHRPTHSAWGIADVSAAAFAADPAVSAGGSGSVIVTGAGGSGGGEADDDPVNTSVMFGGSRTIAPSIIADENAPPKVLPPVSLTAVARKPALKVKTKSILLAPDGTPLSPVSPPSANATAAASNLSQPNSPLVNLGDSKHSSGKPASSTSTPLSPGSGGGGSGKAPLLRAGSERQIRAHHGPSASRNSLTNYLSERTATEQWSASAIGPVWMRGLTISPEASWSVTLLHRWASIDKQVKAGLNTLRHYCAFLRSVGTLIESSQSAILKLHADELCECVGGRSSSDAAIAALNKLLDVPSSQPTIAAATGPNATGILSAAIGIDDKTPVAPAPTLPVNASPLASLAPLRPASSSVLHSASGEDHMQHFGWALLHSTDVMLSEARRQMAYARLLLTNAALGVEPIAALERTRLKTVKEEESQAQAIGDLNLEVEKMRLSALATWEKLQTLRKARDAEMIAVPQNIKKCADLDRDLFKLRDKTRAQFEEFETSQSRLVMHLVEYRTIGLPERVRTMQWIETERLTVQQKLIASAVAAERELRTPIPVAETLRREAAELDVKSELLFTIDRWMKGEGAGTDRFPTTMNSLPCMSAHLKTDEWLKPPRAVDTNKPLLRTAGRAHTQIWRGQSVLESVGLDSKTAAAAVTRDDLGQRSQFPLRRDTSLAAITTAPTPSVAVPVPAAVPAGGSGSTKMTSPSTSPPPPLARMSSPVIRPLSPAAGGVPGHVAGVPSIDMKDKPATGGSASSSGMEFSSAHRYYDLEPEEDEEDVLGTEAVREDWVRALKDHNLTKPIDPTLLSFRADDIIRVFERTLPTPTAVAAAALVGKNTEPVCMWKGSIVGDKRNLVGLFPRDSVGPVDKRVILENSEAKRAAAGFSFSNLIRGTVSKSKKRWQADGFDLDLSYITPQIIAMGFPAEGTTGIYRNPMKDVQRFLTTRHPKAFFVMNLCAEMSYMPSMFENRVRRYPFPDHHPPKLDAIESFCRDVRAWLEPATAAAATAPAATATTAAAAAPVANGAAAAAAAAASPAEPVLHVAAIHCKAGKGRTGTLIAAYLIDSGFSPDADHALRYFACKRTHNSKGVTIPSQRRYVHYYDRCLALKREYALQLAQYNAALAAYQQHQKAVQQKVASAASAAPAAGTASAGADGFAFGGLVGLGLTPPPPVPIPPVLLPPQRNPCALWSISMHPIPRSIRSSGVDVYFTATSDVAKQIDYTSQSVVTPDRHLAEDYVILQSQSAAANGMCVVNDDTLITFYHSALIGTTKMFAFWFNTRMLTPVAQTNTPAGGTSATSAAAGAVKYQFVLRKSELDGSEPDRKMGCGSSSPHAVTSVDANTTGSVGVDSTKAGAIAGTTGIRFATDSTTRPADTIKIDISGPAGPGTGSKQHSLQKKISNGTTTYTTSTANGTPVAGGLLQPPVIMSGANSTTASSGHEMSFDQSARSLGGTPNAVDSPMNNNTNTNNTNNTPNKGNAATAAAGFGIRTSPPHLNAGATSSYGVASNNTRSGQSDPNTPALATATLRSSIVSSSGYVDTNPFTPANVSPRQHQLLSTNASTNQQPIDSSRQPGLSATSSFPAVVITPDLHMNGGVGAAGPANAHPFGSDPSSFSVATASHAHTIAGPVAVSDPIVFAPTATAPNLYGSTVAGPAYGGSGIPPIANVAGAAAVTSGSMNSAQFQSRPPMHHGASLLQIPTAGGDISGRGMLVSTPSHAGGSPKSGMSLMSDAGSDPATGREPIERPVPELSISRVPASPVSATAPYAPG